MLVPAGRIVRLVAILDWIRPRVRHWRFGLCVSRFGGSGLQGLE
jgi:hypothetical protein